MADNESPAMCADMARMTRMVARHQRALPVSEPPLKQALLHRNYFEAVSRDSPVEKREGMHGLHVSEVRRLRESSGEAGNVAISQPEQRDPHAMRVAVGHQRKQRFAQKVNLHESIAAPDNGAALQSHVATTVTAEVIGEQTRLLVEERANVVDL